MQWFYVVMTLLPDIENGLASQSEEVRSWTSHSDDSTLMEDGDDVLDQNQDPSRPSEHSENLSDAQAVRGGEETHQAPVNNTHSQALETAVHEKHAVLGISDDSRAGPALPAAGGSSNAASLPSVGDHHQPTAQLE